MDETRNPPGVSDDAPRDTEAGPVGDHATRVAALVARLQHDRLEVLPFYHDLRNQVVHPLNLHVETRYFFRKWKPVLGPVLTLLIMELRDRCYYNPRTGERRDYCWPSQDELARAIGVSVRTVIRALQDPRAKKFIRVQHRYRYDSTMGKKVRTSSAYVVAMDDPLLPADEGVLTRLVAEQILAEETTRRNQLLAGESLDQDDILAARSGGGDAPDLTAILARKPPAQLTDNLSVIDNTANLAEEEILTGRDSHEQEEGPEAVTPAAAHPPEAPAELAPELIRTYADANDRQPTTLERQRLIELVRRFDAVARRAQPPSSGSAWVIAAIITAVDSGSAFVAPRRIATICERWARDVEAAPRRRERGTPGRVRRSSARDRARVEAMPPDARTDAEPTPLDPLENRPEVVIPTFVVSASHPVTNWQLWRLVTDELCRQVGGEQHRPWLEQAALVGQDDAALVIGASSRFARDLLERRLAAPLAQVIAAILGERYALRFVVSQTWLRETPSER